MKLTIREIIYALGAVCLAATLFIVGVIMLFYPDTEVLGYAAIFLGAVINGGVYLTLDERRCDNRNRE